MKTNSAVKTAAVLALLAPVCGCSLNAKLVPLSRDVPCAAEAEKNLGLRGGAATSFTGTLDMRVSSKPVNIKKRVRAAFEAPDKLRLEVRGAWNEPLLMLTAKGGEIKAHFTKENRGVTALLDDIKKRKGFILGAADFVDILRGNMDPEKFRHSELSGTEDCSAIRALYDAGQGMKYEYVILDGNRLAEEKILFNGRKPVIIGYKYGEAAGSGLPEEIRIEDEELDFRLTVNFREGNTGGGNLPAETFELNFPPNTCS